MSEKLRIDKYLWAIRVFKTRTQADTACKKGKVKNDGKAVKPSKPVSIGDQYEMKMAARNWVIEVTDLLDQRVKYEEAIKYYVDLTPKEALQNHHAQQAFYTGKRMSRKGRPTKKERRDLDDFMDS